MIHRLMKSLHSFCCSVYGALAPNYKKSYAQCGEDLLLRSFLAEKFGNRSYHGFWVDIGAHDPVRYSNTKIFSDNGWRGINVDALPEAIWRFNKKRKRDINVHVGIGLTPGELDYYTFDEPAVNTFSKAFADATLKTTNFKLKAIEKVPVISLSALLDKHLPSNQNIDFLTIDTEGLDLEILQSNNWSKYKPEIILIEIHTQNRRNDEIPSGPVSQFLNNHGYHFAGQCLSTTLYAKNA